MESLRERSATELKDLQGEFNFSISSDLVRRTTGDGHTVDSSSSDKFTISSAMKSLEGEDLLDDSDNLPRELLRECDNSGEAPKSVAGDDLLEDRENLSHERLLDLSSASSPDITFLLLTTLDSSAFLPVSSKGDSVNLSGEDFLDDNESLPCDLLGGFMLSESSVKPVSAGLLISAIGLLSEDLLVDGGTSSTRIWRTAVNGNSPFLITGLVSFSGLDLGADSETEPEFFPDECTAGDAWEE